jgi:hypothetical protein
MDYLKKKSLVGEYIVLESVYSSMKFKNMRRRFFISEQRERLWIPSLILIIFLSSITLTSFHNHHTEKSTDNCSVCNFQITYSATALAPTADCTLFLKPLPENAIIFNDTITDPSQKIVCSSHAPPQFS